MIRTAYLLVSTALLATTSGFTAAPQAAAPRVAVDPTSYEGRAAGVEVEIARIARSRDGMFYLTLQVNDRPVRFLVDTGASMAVLNKADAARAGVEAGHNDATKMRTAGGLQSIRWAVADRLAIAGSSKANIDYGPVEVAIADLDSASLLGQNALSRLGTVTIRGDVMTVSVPATETGSGAAGSAVRGEI